MNHSLENINVPFIKNSKNKQDEKLLQPYSYILQVPGLKIIQALHTAFNYWLDIPEHTLVEIVDIVKMIANALLMIDDIEDDSMVRRGIPSTHIIYGIPATLNSANYVMFMAMRKAHYLTSRKGASFDMNLLMEEHRGQGMEIYWRENSICPTEEEYFEMVTRKSGCFFTMNVQLMQVFSENKSDFTNLSTLMGIHYQIQDDYLNLFSPDYYKYKGFCDDISEGKFSFPLIHAINSNSNSEVLDILKMRTTDVELKKHCVSLLKESGSAEYTRNKLNSLREQILNEVEKLGGNPSFKNYIDKIFYA